MTTAAIYCRISQDRLGDAAGVARQRQDCRELISCQPDWVLAGEYIDNDISVSGRRKRKRPEYDQLIAEVIAGRVDVIVLYMTARLWRNRLERAIAFETLAPTGIKLRAVKGPEFDLSSAAGRLVAGVLGEVDTHEIDQMSERIRRKHLELAENGKVSGGGMRPFGYEKDRLTVIEAEADLIREAAARVLAGDGVRTVAADWKRRGIATVTGADWTGTTIKRMLRSARICGWREHHGKWIAEAEWPAIIDPEDGRRLRRLLDDPSRSNGPTTVRSSLLAGYVYCGRCGTRMAAAPVYRKGHRYRRYACLTQAGGCNRCGIAGEPLEAVVVAAVLHRLDTAKLAKAIAKRRRETASTVSAVDDIEGRMDDLAAMFAAGEITRNEWSTARRGLTDRMTAAQQAEAEHVRMSAVDSQLAAPDVIRNEWPNMPLDRQRLIVAAILDRVTIAATTKAGNRFDPDRIDITWKV